MSKKLWVTTEMKEFLQSPEWNIHTNAPGGGVDTEGLVFTANGSTDPDVALTLCGFNSDGDDIIDPGCAPVDMLELTDGEDSSGGLNTDDEPTCIMYAKIISKLRKAGWYVVPSLDQYF